MARIDEDELIEHWTLIGGELAEVAGKRGPARLAFALLLKFYTRRGRFPRGRGELPDEAVAYVARQMKVPASDLGLYEWSGRTFERCGRNTAETGHEARGRSLGWSSSCWRRLRGFRVTSVDRTAYPRFGRVVSGRELAESFTPTDAEIEWARTRTQDEQRLLALVVWLKSYQRLGYFPKVDDVPPAVVRHVRDPGAGRKRGAGAGGRADGQAVPGARPGQDEGHLRYGQGAAGR